MKRGVPRHRGRLLWKIPLAVLATIVLVLFAASFFGDEPLRRTIQSKMNGSLKGYKASVGHAHLSIFGLSVTLGNVAVAQEANPDPPVLAIPHLKASVHWKELLTLHLVADFLFDHPHLHVNRPQLLKEASDEVPVKDRGWQQALEDIYPLKVNLLRIDEGDLTYIDREGAEPLTVTHLKVRATNIRNIRSKAHDYPSPVEASGVVLGTGRGSVRGHANFLAEPTPGFHVLYDVTDVPLGPFRPLVTRSNLDVKAGIVSTSGEIELAPGVQLVHVKDLAVKKVIVDYLHTPTTTASEQQTARTVKTAAKQAAASPTTDLRVEHLTLADSELGFVNTAKDPAYRLYFSGFTLDAQNLSAGLKAGPAVVRATGRFMGSGPTDVRATFRPDAKGPNFDVAVAINDTELKRLNDLLTAYGKFDVTAGSFSFFSELTVRNGMVNGYVKPLFRDMQVYDPRQDAGKGFFHNLYEKVVGGVSKLLKNRQRSEVATKTPISGPIGSPKMSVSQVVLKLVQNAFFQAILPGFDLEVIRRHAGASAAKKEEPRPAGS